MGCALTNCAVSNPIAEPHISQARPARLSALALTMSVYRIVSFPSSLGVGHGFVSGERVTIRSRISASLQQTFCVCAAGI